MKLKALLLSLSIGFSGAALATPCNDAYQEGLTEDDIYHLLEKDLETSVQYVASYHGLDKTSEALFQISHISSVEFAELFETTCDSAADLTIEQVFSQILVEWIES